MFGRRRRFPPWIVALFLAGASLRVVSDGLAADPPHYQLVESSLTGVQALTNRHTTLRGRFASAPGGEARGGHYQLQALARPIMVVPGALPTPELRISLVTANLLRVEWPSDAAGFQLEVSDDLSANRWTPIGQPGNTTVEFPIESTPRFYRLHRLTIAP